MMSFQDNGENVKRIVLPSGKTIEVVSFEDVTGQLAASEPVAETTPAPADGLHVCTELQRSSLSRREVDLVEGCLRLLHVGERLLSRVDQGARVGYPLAHALGFGGVGDRGPQVEALEVRVALAGEDQREGDRAVE